MARALDIGGNNRMFVGEDRTLRFEILGDGSNVPLDVPWDASGWDHPYFCVRKTDASPTIVLEKLAVISGGWNIVRALNGQRAIVTLNDDDLNLLRAKTYRYSLKRMDEGAEQILYWGNFTLQQATAR